MKVAVIVQRYGENIVCGSETLARQTVETLKQDWDITVLTTCANNYEWTNFFSPGDSKVGGVNVKRFPIEKEGDVSFSTEAFKEEKSAFHLAAEEEKSFFVNQGPFCPKLVEFLSQSKDKYDAFIFFTYLYYPTVFGVPEVASRAYVVATADEQPPTNFIKTYAPLFHSLKGIIYHSDSDLNSLNQIYSIPEHIKKIPFGYSVPTPLEPSSIMDGSIRQECKDMQNKDYFLFVGRPTKEKGFDNVLRSFKSMKEKYDLDATLVVASESSSQKDSSADLLYFDNVTEIEKSFLLDHACALVNPAAFDSLSLVALEAWKHGTFVIADGTNSVIKNQCDLSGGGIYYHSPSMLEAELAWCLKNKASSKALAAKGQEYVDSHYSWANVRKSLVANVF